LDSTSNHDFTVIIAEHNEMNRTNAVQSGIRIYVMLAVALGVYQMVSYQMGARNRPIDATANSTNVETNSTDGVPSEPTNQTAVPSNVQVFATMRLEPGAREVLQSNGIESAILSYELKGVDWIYNICINYGHILVAMVIYNKFKEGGNEGGRKFKLLALGAIVVFGWIYLANTLAIERVAVRSKSGKLLYHADHTFTKERFDEFVK
jgi:hypothetical protein